MTVQEQFGQIDIYLFDHILRGNITPAMRVLDAGCGFGRNLIYLLREGCDVYAVDTDELAVNHVRRLAASLGNPSPSTNFRTCAIEQMTFPDSFADLIICSAVLHFARNREHFVAMLNDIWRVLRPGGMLFCRLASQIGMEFEPLRDGTYRVGNSEWFLVDEAMLLALVRERDAELVDPLKTTIVQGRRCMTTWVLRKPKALDFVHTDDALTEIEMGPPRQDRKLRASLCGERQSPRFDAAANKHDSKKPHERSGDQKD
jgi:tellurite methyltransferase